MTLRFTLDTACVIAMVKTESNNPPGEVEAIARLIDLAREGGIELQLTVAYDRDFDRFKTPEGRVRQIDWLACAPIAGQRASGLFIVGVSEIDGPDNISSDEDAETYRTIRTILDCGVEGVAAGGAEPAWQLAKRTSDADHLIAHRRSGADAFVTLDDSTILVHRDALRQRHIAVLWPSEAVAMVEDAAQRRYRRNWKLSASMLALVALLVATATLLLLEPKGPWALVVYFVVIAVVLVAGTLWLVPRSDTRR